VVQPPAIDRAIHLAPGRAAGARLREAGARHVALLEDDLTHGPSSSDPRAHARLRRAHRAEVSGADARGAGDLAATLDLLPGELPVVLWTSGAWRDLLAAARALVALRRARVPARRIRLARAEGPQPIGERAARSLRSLLARAHPIRPGELRGAVSVWRAFTARTPAALDRLRRRPGVFPGLAAAAAEHAALFPRLDARAPGRLSLSTLDRALLAGLSRFWWRAVADVTRAAGRAGRTLAWAHGEALLRQRLLDWCAVEPDPPAEFRVRARASRPEILFRVTPAGRRLLAEGLADPRRAPPLAAGGQVSYRGRPTWACAVEGGAWRLVPWRKRRRRASPRRRRTRG
jgi:hypothetical protein